MRVSLFHTTLPAEGRKLGGVEVAVDRLATALVEAGADVTVWSVTSPPGGATYRWRPVAARAPWLARLGPLRWVGVPIALNLTKLGTDADVVHLHGDDWFWVRRRTATVRTFHGSARREAAVATNRWFRASQHVVARLEQISGRLADLTLAIGADTAEVLAADFVVGNATATAAFAGGTLNGRPTVLFVGTWGGRKRGAFAAERFLVDVLPRVPDARLVMVSDRIEVDHPAIEWAPNPTDVEIVRLQQSAWVLFHPSTYEGFGIPYVEAMAAKTAVVSSPNPGAWWVLDGGAAGVIAGDDEIGGAVADLLLDPGKRAGLIEAGLLRAETFSSGAVAADHLMRYGEAVSRRAARRSTRSQASARASGR